MHRSHRWATRSVNSFEKKSNYSPMNGSSGNQALYGIVQGGIYNDLRDESINFNDIEKNFDKNSKDYANIFKIKKYSDEFFLENNQTFDVIYVDGHHLAEQVYKDAVNSWNVLR